MHRLLCRFLLALLPLLPLPAMADGVAGQFDYYVAALSWSPSYCAQTGDAKHDHQCDAGTGHGWILHGLWPQYDSGYPEGCKPVVADATDAQLRDISTIMGDSERLARHEWQKHGRCSGLSATDYFAKARRAYAAINRPASLRSSEDTLHLPARDVEKAFLTANPQLDADEITVVCSHSRISEIRVCLTKDLTPRKCGPDVIHDCRKTAALPPVR